MELWKDLITSKALASNQDSSEGKPAHSGSFYKVLLGSVFIRIHVGYRAINLAPGHSLLVGALTNHSGISSLMCTLFLGMP